MEGVWIAAVLPILAYVGVDHREYFHDEFSELRAAVVVRVLFVFNKSGKRCCRLSFSWYPPRYLIAVVTYSSNILLDIVDV
jgi:hypothetical protein